MAEASEEGLGSEWAVVPVIVVVVVVLKHVKFLRHFIEQWW